MNFPYLKKKKTTKNINKYFCDPNRKAVLFFEKLTNNKITLKSKKILDRWKKTLGKHFQHFMVP